MKGGGRGRAMDGDFVTHVFLVRGIGPASHSIMTMKALEAACQAQGLPGTRNLLATGNLIVTSDLAGAEVEVRFAQALQSGRLRRTWQRRNGLQIQAAAAGLRNLPDFAMPLATRPARVQLHFLAVPVSDAALAGLRVLAPDTRIQRVGDEVVIDYGASISQSVLTLARLDKVFGPAQTARNWNTVCKIEALLCGF